MMTFLSLTNFDSEAYARIVEGYDYSENVMIERDIANATNNVIATKINSALIRHANM